MTEPQQKTWPCSAYGPEGLETGALCFVSPELHKRVCETQATCAAVMTEERQRLFGRIQDLAAAGDETAAFLAGESTSPDQLLNVDGAGA